MSTYPSGPLTPLGASLLAEGTDYHLWASSQDGSSQFYLNGALAPIAPGVPGQDGMIVTGERGLGSPPFKHIDLQAALQDGVTWTNTVYEPGQIDLDLEAHARTPQALQALIDEWKGMWNPRTLVRLEHITLDGGYWYCDARLLPKSWGDQNKIEARRLRMLKMTHSCRIDNTFWLGMDSTCSFSPSYESFGDKFTTPTDSGLGDDWAVTYSEGHTGHVYVAESGGVYWADSGNSTQSVVCIYNTPTDTDDQIITVNMGGSFDGVTILNEAFNDIWGRADSTGANGIRVRIAWTGVIIERFNDGVPTLLWFQPLLIPPLPNEPWTLVCGSKAGSPRSFALQRSGIQILSFTESNDGSALGADYRYAGFGGQTAGGFDGAPMASFIPVAGFAAADNEAVATVSGFIQLTNVGDQDGWPRYLVYGPGTFSFADGPNSDTMISFGPLEDGQVALITTLPRLRSVVDLTPGTTSPATASAAQKGLLQSLLSYVTNGIVGALDQLESLFGVLPPQTTTSAAGLYSLLNGRFSNPIPGVETPSQAQPVLIPVTIQGGNASSKVIAALTPMRTCPA
ncbi:MULTISPECIES: hypothetical protein [unclassified Mycobacterium]|uniref:DUF7257 domain-containing protein n=1 Tax=unclassified Mycobacterium TaxID=2642494 RepID=UPI000801F998|nr:MULTISPECIES: hypothetical protein [unclassified Mycobacterium]OBG71325.1 hypothetical protein A5700_12190 [Mycobacterium sp. E1214]OBH28693.1 hypothetical protein A5693_21505 [Mycobacterium sp. E1319]